MIPYKLDKEQISRNIILSNSGHFLDIGGGNGELRYLFGVSKGKFSKARYKANKAIFDTKYKYFNQDLSKGDLVGDICSRNFDFPQYSGFFDIVYSNNTFEHLLKPWIAIENICKLLKPGGHCIIIAPFAWRYHEVPNDYFRYSHTVIPCLFNELGEFETIISGYDTNQRRHYNQGSGQHNDMVPGLLGWRESWQMITVVKKK